MFVELCIDMPEAEYFDKVDDRFYAMLNELHAQPVVSLDTETTGLRRFDDRIKFFSMAWDGLGSRRRLCLHQRLLPQFVEEFQDPQRTWIFANAKYDLHLLANNGALSDGVRCPIAGNIADVMVMHSLLYEGSHALKEMAKSVLGWTWQDFFDVFGKPDKDIPGHAGMLLDEAFAKDPGMLIEYASNDAWGTLGLYDELKRQLEAAPTIRYIDENDTDVTLADVYFQHEMPFTKVLWKMERRGARVDLGHLEKLRVPLQAAMVELSKKIASATGGAVLKPTSRDQLDAYLIGTKGVFHRKKTKGGKAGIKKQCLDEEVLTEIAESHEDPEVINVCNLVLEYRGIQKILSTYVEGILKQNRNGLVHTTYNQHRTATGRLSSTEPNLQHGGSKRQ